MLLGGAIAGLTVELATITNVSAMPAVIAVFLISVVGLFTASEPLDWWYNAKINGRYYLVALVPAVFSPFAILGTWDGDWLLLFQGGQAIFAGEPLTGKMLERPPMFGASAAPLWCLQNSLASYQVFCAVMSAGLLVQLHAMTKRYFPNCQPWVVVGLFALSAFFLHHTAACWGKLMAGSFMLAAVESAYREGPQRRYARAAICFAISVAIHQSSILYVPLLAAVYWYGAPISLSNIVRCVLSYAIAGLFLVGLFEFWTVREYGLDAKINANPSTSQRPDDLSFAANTLMIVLSSFVGWSPINNVVRWWGESNRWQLQNMIAEFFWLLTSWLQISAGTFLVLSLPFLVSAPRRLSIALATRIQTLHGLTFAGAATIIVVLNAMINPFHSASGSMQTGLVPLGIMALWLLSTWASNRRDVMLRAITWTLSLATLPWIGLMTVVTVGMNFSESFRSIIQNGSEGDWGRLVVHSLKPLGLSVFPAAHLVIVTAILFVALQSFHQPLVKQSNV